MNHDNDNGLRFLSVCSGIEAASVAWGPLGWKAVAVSEIESGPCSVLKHHYPDVPNLGDMTKFKEWPDYGKDGKQPIDLLCGGTPCQSFSVAGLRSGLADPRGNLALTFLAIADRYKPKWIFWENVPGVLSSTSHVSADPCEPEEPMDVGLDGQEMETDDEYDAEEVHAFNSFLAGLSELGYGWAYVIRDAQYVRVDGFARAVPQRRRRVFVVGYLGDWRRAAAVLLEPESMCGNSPPRRQAGENVAADVAPSLTASGRGVERSGETRGQDPVIAVANTAAWDGHPTLCRDPGGPGSQDWQMHAAAYVAPMAFGGGNTAGSIDVAACLTTKNMRIDFDAETFMVTREVAATLTRGSENENGNRGIEDDGATETLRAASHGALPMVAYGIDSEHNGRLELMCPMTARSGTGGLWPTVAHTIQAGALRENPSSGPDGVGVQADIAYTLEARAEVQAVAFDLRNGTQDDVAMSLQAGGMGDDRGLCPNAIPHTLSEWAVRRLTPKECARLQGFPDDYLSVVTHNGKPLADGPMYKALGNSWPVNTVRWIGRRIQLVEDVARELANDNTPIKAAA